MAQHQKNNIGNSKSSERRDMHNVTIALGVFEHSVHHFPISQ